MSSFRGAVTLVFDDGYQAVFDQVLPLLARYRVHAVFAVPVDTERLARDEGAPVTPLAAWKRACADAGHELAAHGVTHRALPRLTNEELERELRAARDATGSTTLVYPGGAHDARVAAAAQRYFRAARTVLPGFAHVPPRDPYRLPSFASTRENFRVWKWNLRALAAWLTGRWVIETHHTVAFGQGSWATGHGKRHTVPLDALDAHLRFLTRLPIRIATIREIMEEREAPWASPWHLLRTAEPRRSRRDPLRLRALALRRDTHTAPSSTPPLAGWPFGEGGSMTSEKDAGGLSVITITKNEEAHLPRALKSVEGLADEIIVIDSESTDRTVEIAKQHTAQVHVRPFSGFGALKNAACELATKEWILHIDADEEAPPTLADEIRHTLAAPRHDFYWLPVVTEFLGRPLPHLQGKNLRLFRRLSGRWDDAEVHEQVLRQDGTRVRLGDTDNGILTTPLIHHGHYQTLAQYRERQERYSRADAIQMMKTGADRLGKSISVNVESPLSVARLLTERATKQFIRKFFWQRGFLDGWQGWLWCYVSAEYEVKMCAKYLALRKEPAAQ